MVVMSHPAIHDGGKRCTGRPPVTIDPARVRELAGLQLSVGQIATCLGISRRCLFGRMKSDPLLRTAYQAGISDAIYKASSVVMNAIDEGDVRAAMFFLRVHAGWTEPSSSQKLAGRPLA
jgi:hypothetical protein